MADELEREARSAGRDGFDGDNIKTGNIAGEGIAIGRNARVEITRYEEFIVRVDSLEELPPKPGEPPYKGLTYFTEADAKIFFGREQLSDDLAARLKTKRFLAVVGASGSGKSSLLRAGVVPRLRQKNWQIHIVTPTANPLGRLATSLTKDDEALDAADKMRVQLLAEPQTLRQAAEKLAARGNYAQFLLIVDQFEELFTLCQSAEAQRAFLENLLAAATSVGGVHILIGLRADFTGYLTEPKELKDLVQENIVLLGRMEQEDLVRVIMEPAKVGGWAFVDGLVEQILKDVGREPGRLPLLSHALLETWERRSAHVMTLKGYQEAGGVDGAIAKTAEDTLRRLGDDEKRAIMQSIFLELTELGEGAEDTRRIVKRDEIARTNDEADVHMVLEALVTARLVTVDGESVEVAHEALIRRWPTLREWLEDNRERLRFERQFERDAEEWEEFSRDDGYLYRGAQLARAIELIDSGSVSPTHLTDEFLKASQNLAEREERQREEQLQKELEQTRELAQKTEEARVEAVRVNHRNLALLGIISTIAAILLINYVIFPNFQRWSAANNKYSVPVPVEFEDGSIVSFEPYEVTNERYSKCVEARKCYRPTGYENLREDWESNKLLPVVGISADDAMTFCEWIGRTLPTAEQWDNVVVPADEWGLMPKDQAVFCREEPCQLEPVGDRTISQTQNKEYHIFDLVGNAGEWTRTIVDDDNRCRDLLEFPQSSEITIVVGDHYEVPFVYAGSNKTVNQQGDYSTSRRQNVGFRCVSLAQKPMVKEYDCPSLLD